jgi:hypothetical protein
MFPTAVLVAQQYPARGGVISTIVLAVPTPSYKASHTVALTPSHLSVREANILAGGGVIPTAALTMPMS